MASGMRQLAGTKAMYRRADAAPLAGLSSDRAEYKQTVGTSMSSFFLLCILQRIVLCFCAIAAPTSMMQDGKLISEIGKLFGDALRELSEEKPAPAQPAAVMQAFGAPPQKMAPGEADRKKHADRTQTLAGAMQSWITQICQLDAAQQEKLQTVVIDSLKVEGERYGKKDDPNRGTGVFGPTTPLLFVHSDNGKTTTVNGQKIDSIGAIYSDHLLKLIQSEILNDPQKEQLDAALTERLEFQNAAFREYVVTLFDQELFLTEDQRRKMLEQISARSKKITSPFYSFSAQQHYLPNKSLSEVVSASKADFLDSRQKGRLKDLLADGDGNQNYIMFQSSEGVEQWEETVKQEVPKQRMLYLNAAAVRIGYLERSLKLKAEQVQYLTVASKGATLDALADWKVSTQQTIDQMKQHMAQAQGNFGFSAQNISVDGLDQNEIWTSAVREVHGDIQTGERSAAIRRAKANTVTALLDQEMWLMPTQRAAVLEFTEASMPRNFVKSDYDQYVRELILLVYPLHKVAETKVHEVLSEPQQAVWMQLQGFFQFNQGGVNHVQIPLGDQGGAFSVQLGE